MPPPEEPKTMDFLLATVARLHHYRVHELVEGLGLYRGQPPLLYELWKQDGRTHSDLAAKMQITPATITRMIQRMEKAGFVQRRPDEHDQRVSRVYLTEEGRAVQSELQAVFERLERETFAGFNEQELVVLRGFLGRIRANLQAVTGEQFEE